MERPELVRYVSTGLDAGETPATWAAGLWRRLGFESVVPDEIVKLARTASGRAKALAILADFDEAAFKRAARYWLFRNRNPERFLEREQRHRARLGWLNGGRFNARTLELEVLRRRIGWPS